MIEKIVTARGPEYAVGNLVWVNPNDDYSKIISIEWQCGDYEVGSTSAYNVNLNDGRTVVVRDAVEIWRTPEPDPMIDIGDGVKAHPSVLAAILTDDEPGEAPAF